MSCEIQIGGFLGALDSMARVVGSGQATDGTLRAELGKVLGVAVRYTSSPTPAEAEDYGRFRLRRRFNKYSGGDIGTAAASQLPLLQECPGKGHSWWIDRNAQGARTFYLMSGGQRRWSDRRWAAYVTERADRESDFAVELGQYLPKVRRAAGLEKKSWVEIGDSLGIEVTAPGYVRASVAQSGRFYQNGQGIREETADSLTYTLTNAAPMLIAPRRREDAPGRVARPRNDGFQILQSAFSTREAAIFKGLEVGVFDDLEKAVRRFPGVAFVR